MQQLTVNTASYPSTATHSTPNAASGPSRAPAVSSARCTPKARPCSPGGTDSEISASRGAVRRPLPVRSAASTAATDQGVATASRAALQAAESA